MFYFIFSESYEIVLIFQTRKFSIKVFVCVNSILKVREEAKQEYGYNLQRDGWLNVFTDEKSQVMRTDMIPWRGAREKYHVSFSILLAILIDNNDIIMDWQCGVCTPSLLASFLL